MKRDFSIEFTIERDSQVSPDNYYLTKCIGILEDIFKEENCKFKQINAGGGDDFIWIDYEYIESDVYRTTGIMVAYEGDNIKILYDIDDTSVVSSKFLYNLNAAKNTWV
jgi:hypothetical protein